MTLLGDHLYKTLTVFLPETPIDDLSRENRWHVDSDKAKENAVSMFQKTQNDVYKIDFNGHYAPSVTR